jgi:4-hydroxy-3-methylbut-2-enyl diphosphate reductase
LRQPLNLLLVIGGYNSSNTSHLAEMGESKLPTYFIKNAAKMVSDDLIVRASCPNNLIEDTIRRLFELRGISVRALLEAN